MAWSLAFDACVACQTTERPHRARGLCRRCYGAQPEYASRHNARNRRRRDSDEFRARTRTEYRTNPRRCAQIKRSMWVTSMLRRAEAAGVPIGDVTFDGLLARIEFYGGRCWMCGADWEHMDHVKPLSKGGPHTLSNLRPSCASCNSTKSDTWDGTDTAKQLVAA